MAIYLMWSIVITVGVSRIIAARFDSHPPLTQKSRGLTMVSDPVVLIALLSIGFGGMIAGAASIDYSGVLLVITLLSLSVCREPSFLLQTYSISIAMLASLASVVALSGVTLILVSGITPLIGALVIKVCQWLGAKIEW
jgi:hypothetical protein